MTIEQFLLVQEQVVNAFGWLLRWWLILFFAGGIAAAGFLVFLVSARAMLDRSITS